MNKIPPLKTTLASLIGVPSISSVSPEFDQSNMGVIHLLAQWCADLGFQVEIMPVPHESEHKANLIAMIGSGPGGLVLAGHTDTVPYDEQKWRVDPFQLTEKDQRFYGLGIADMKCFFSLALEAVARLDTTTFNRPLIILATADEESSMDGAKTLVNQGKPKARFAVIGEPTGFKPVNVHKGMMMEAVHIFGKAGHSSDPSLGESAIEGLGKVIELLTEWRAGLQQQFLNEQFKVPFPTLNLGLVAGGDNPNRICAHSRLHFDLRTLPGMDIDTLRNDLDQRLQQLQAGGRLEFKRIPLIEGTPAFATADDSPLVRSLERLSGHRRASVAFCTEGPYLNELGMETVIWGPGDIAQAHQPDEYLALQRIKPAVDVLEKLIIEHCITAGT